jgi:hypothetical protein
VHLHSLFHLVNIYNYVRCMNPCHRCIFHLWIYNTHQSILHQKRKKFSQRPWHTHLRSLKKRFNWFYFYTYLLNTSATWILNSVTLPIFINTVQSRALFGQSKMKASIESKSSNDASIFAHLKFLIFQFLVIVQNSTLFIFIYVGRI